MAVSDMNNVFLIGRLTRDAELRYTNSDIPVCKFSIAVNRRKRSGDRWEAEANFFDVVLWGKLGPALEQYLTKGKQVGITGELRQNRWEQNGQARSKVEIVATDLQLLGGNTPGGGPSGERKSSYSRQGNAQNTEDSFDSSNDTDFGGPGGFEDDIPF